MHAAGLALGVASGVVGRAELIDLYWFEAEAEHSGDFISGFTADEIRRAPRLPKP